MLYLKDYAPVSQLVVPEHPVENPRYPVVDAHNHLLRGDLTETEAKAQVERLLEIMEKAGVQMIVDLTRAWGQALQFHLDMLQSRYPERFSVFACVDWERLRTEADFGTWAAQSLADSVARGARGLKIFKEFGLRVRDADEKLVTVDDPRVAPLWEKAGELDIPVLIHVADPVAFFRPLDRFNERYEELSRHPSWHFYGPAFPPFETIIEQFGRLIERHPGTTFVGAHVGCYPENLAHISDMLDRYPNFYVDISARIAELGRRPYSARRFFLDYADRILFGTDVRPNVAHYRVHYRFLETADEYFRYGISQIPGQGRWRIYGLDLPDEVLAKVYYDNARRVLFGGQFLPERGE
jgi:predicted TIM-barrel fold metal-dependent hydrolase